MHILARCNIAKDFGHVRLIHPGHMVRDGMGHYVQDFIRIFFPTGKFNLSVATEHKMPPDSKYTCLESVRFVDLGSVCVFLVENLNPNGRMRPLRLKLGRFRCIIQINIYIYMYICIYLYIPMSFQSRHFCPQICLVQRHAEFLEELQVGEVCRDIIQRQTGRHRHLKCRDQMHIQGL